LRQNDLIEEAIQDLIQKYKHQESSAILSEWVRRFVMEELIFIVFAVGAAIGIAVFISINGKLDK
jgi:hypothetical protein